jgi:enoyl-CoA hydratase/carnithine racemase
MSGTEALDVGLLNRVVPDGQVLSSAVEFAAELARGPRYALRAAKAAIDRGMRVDLDTGLEIERLQASALMSTPDPVIGIESFLRAGAGKASFHTD